MSRPLAGPGFGSLSVCTALFALAVSLSACEAEPGLTLRPVELVDPGSTDPFETDPLLAPRGGDCGDCVPQRIELPGGDVVTVRGDPKAALRLGPEVVASIELAIEDDRAWPAVEGGTAAGETPPGAAEAGGIERYAVYAVFDEAAGEAWRRFAAAHARRFVLVEIGERPVDLVRPLGWSRGLRIGVFEDEAARAAFVRSLPFGRPPARAARRQP